MGYSLGAGVALQTAIRHPDVVGRLVLVSAAMRLDGFYPEAVAAFKQLEADAATLGDGVKASPLGKAYPDVDWTNLFRKVERLGNGYATAKSQHIFRDFIDAVAHVMIEEREITVRFQKRAHNPLLMAASFAKADLPVPWLGKRRLRLLFG